MRTKNKIWASVCAFFAAVCSAFGLTQLNTQTQATAETSAVVGLQSATLNRIEASGGVASNVVHIEFDGLNDDVWFLTHFTGKNVPNFAVNAKGGYETWNKDMWNATDGGAGIVLASTYETRSGYGAGGLVVANSLNTTSSHGVLNKNLTATANNTIVSQSGDAPMGMANFDAETEYIMILGWDRANGVTKKAVSYYVYSVDNGVFTEVGKNEFTVGTATPTGGKAVIYGNIGTAATAANTGAEEITFGYATPASTLEGLLNGISSDYAYKTQLMKAFKIHASIGETETLTGVIMSANNTGITKEGVTVESIAFDGLSGDTFFMVDFVGQNVPNFAINAKQAYSTWNNEDIYDSGLKLFTTTDAAINNLYIPRKFNTLHNGAGGMYAYDKFKGTGNSGNGPGYGALTAGTHYLMIVGTSGTAAVSASVDTQTVHCYVYKVGSDYTLTSCFAETATFNTAGPRTGATAVIYPHIRWNGSGGANEITFTYATPKSSLAELVMSLDDACLYKEQLIEQFDIQSKTLTMKNAEGNVIGTQEFAASASYVLPESKLADFVGWEYNGALYAAGDSIEADDNITVKAVCMDVDMLDGASARLKIDNEGNGGLRFTVKVKTSEFAALGDKAQLRGVLIPTDKIDGEFDLTEETAKDIPLSDGIEKNDGYTYYHITLTNVLYSNYNREFSARAYVKVTYQDGDTENVLITAYSKDKNSRSIYDIAVDAYNDGYEKDGVLAQYIGNTVNLAYSVDAQENYVLSVITNEDGLNNTSIRNYVIESQSVSTEDGVTSFTVTIKFNVSNLDFEKTPVTLWATGATKGTRIVKPVESVDEENNTVTCFFTLA